MCTMVTQSTHEQISQRLLEQLVEEKPRDAVVGLMVAAATIAKVCNESEGVAQIMRLTAEHVENDTAVHLVAPQ
jgi:truncated hemoglobin YjbI